MKIKILFLALGIVLGSLFMFLLTLESGFQEVSVYTKFQSFSTLNTKGSISCSFPQMISVYYKDGQVEHTLPKPETNPMVFTFSEFNVPSKGMASLSYIDATKTISTVPLGIIFEDEDKIVLIENGGESYLTSYTIFKKQSVAIFSKQILFPFSGGIPSGTTAMGTCS